MFFLNTVCCSRKISLFRFFVHVFFNLNYFTFIIQFNFFLKKDKTTKNSMKSSPPFFLLTICKHIKSLLSAYFVQLTKFSFRWIFVSSIFPFITLFPQEKHVQSSLSRKRVFLKLCTRCLAYSLRVSSSVNSIFNCCFIEINLVSS